MLAASRWLGSQSGAKRPFIGVAKEGGDLPQEHPVVSLSLVHDCIFRVVLSQGQQIQICSMAIFKLRIPPTIFQR
jgi:hypothetical protein